jgi:hypothetical protein
MARVDALLRAPTLCLRPMAARPVLARGARGGHSSNPIRHSTRMSTSRTRKRRRPKASSTVPISPIYRHTRSVFPRFLIPQLDRYFSRLFVCTAGQIQRHQNIAANLAYLYALGLYIPNLTVHESRETARNEERKRARQRCVC